MRVSGFGSGSGPGFGNRERRQAFRRNHAVGQRVVGIFRGWHEDGLAWLEVDGQPLLAHIGGSPEPGQRIFLLIKQLLPDIVLQELPLEARGQGAGLAASAREFWEGRGRFEALFLATASELEHETDPAAREARFLSLLSGNPPLLAAYQNLQRCVEQVNLLLAGRGGGELLLLPWLFPGASEREFLCLPPKGSDQELGEYVLASVFPLWGRGEIRILHKDGRGRFRLLLERPDLSRTAPQLLEPLPQDFRHALALELEFGGVGPLPPGPRTVLAAMLAAEARQVQSRFSTKV